MSTHRARYRGSYRRNVQIGELRAEATAAVQAVHRALQVIDERINSDQITSKGRLDIATGTDVKSQEVIRTRLAQAHPEHAFVGEVRTRYRTHQR